MLHGNGEVLAMITRTPKHYSVHYGVYYVGESLSNLTPAKIAEVTQNDAQLHQGKKFFSIQASQFHRLHHLLEFTAVYKISAVTVCGICSPIFDVRRCQTRMKRKQGTPLRGEVTISHPLSSEYDTDSGVHGTLLLLLYMAD
jgi:hypothetical protein